MNESGQSLLFDFKKWKKSQKKTFKKVFIVISALVVIGIIVIPIAITLNENKRHKEQEIQHPCATAANLIIQATKEKSQAYTKVDHLCTSFGPRLVGSDNLEKAIDWMIQQMRDDDLSNVKEETVEVPKWVRGNEYARMVAPYSKNLEMLGLGGSVNTSLNGLTANVIVVNSFDDLKVKASEVSGTIVLFNVPFTNYDDTKQYRHEGATEAAKLGAVGALLRSATPYSLYTPHAGDVKYDDSQPKIPFAVLTVEDVNIIQNLGNIGENVTVTIYMESHFESNVVSRNIMGELTGSVYPEKVVVIGAHTDSWDVGQGAQDDGAGLVMTWEAVRLLKSLGLKPKRTIRFVGWVDQELTGSGAKNYSFLHHNETVFAIEADRGGANTPFGFQVNLSNPDAMASLKSIASLLAPINANKIKEATKTEDTGSDVEPLRNYGIPVAGLWTDISDYFYYQHTNADTLDKINETNLNLGVASMAVMSFCVADSDFDLPHAK